MNLIVVIFFSYFYLFWRLTLRIVTKILTIFSQKFAETQVVLIDLAYFTHKINLFTKIPQSLKNPYYRDV